MSFRIDITCTDCGKTAKFTLDSFTARQEFRPAASDGLTLEELGLSTRVVNVLRLEPPHGAGLTLNSGVQDLLNLHKHHYCNYGKHSFCELIAAIETRGKRSREEIKRNPLWLTAPKPYRDTISTPKFEFIKEHFQRLEYAPSPNDVSVWKRQQRAKARAGQ